MPGKCKRVTVTKNDTIVLDGAGDKDHINGPTEEGIVPGGGKALLHCLTKLSAVAEASIAAIAGEEGTLVCGELMKEDTPVETGFDAQNGLYCNMHEASIIDPTKVTRMGLVSAANVAGLLATSEAMIC